MKTLSNRKITQSIFIMIVMVVMLSSCRTKAQDNTITITPVTVADSAESDGIEATVKVSAEFPTKGNAILINSIQEWMSETMGGSFFGQVNEGYSMLTYYAHKKMDSFNEFKSPDEKDTVICEWKANFTRLYENDQWITYGYHCEEYSGGAHGNSYDGGCSFRKADGRRLDWGMFDQDKLYALRTMIKDNLQVQYFNFKSSKDLDNNLLNEEDRYFFPLPETPPLFVKKGIRFTYQEYEIVCYAGGIPTCLIPYQQIDSLLSATGKSLIHSNKNKQ